MSENQTSLEHLEQLADLENQILRLEQKRDGVSDQDIQLAIQGRIDSLQSEVVKIKKVHAFNDRPVEEVTADKPEESSEQEVKEAERLIRESVVEKRRGNNQQATALLQKAAKLSPRSPSVLEALGDDLAERGRSEEAIKNYANAKKIDPHNVGLERKHALLVLKVKGANLLSPSDSLLPTSEDAVASMRSARLLSAFFPGLGHIVLGRTSSGIGFLASWVVTVGLIVLFRSDLQELFKLVAGQAGKPTLIVMIPLFAAFVIYFAALGSLSGKSNKEAVAVTPRPKPPVDLPFE